MLTCMQKNWSFKIVFIVAILMIGIFYSALPHFIRYDTLKDQGLRYIAVTQKSNFDLMNVHGGRYREILDGNILSGEVDTHEYRNGPALWPLLSATMVAPFILLTDSVFGGIILSDFVFPVLTFISFFLILHALTRHKPFSLFSAYILMLFPQLPLFIPPSSLVELKILILQFLPLPIGAPTIDLTYLGRESFIPGGAFLILSLFFAYEAVTRKNHGKYFIVIAGLLYGLLFYLYLYFWVFTTIFLGLFFLLLIVFGKRKEAFNIFLAGIIGLIASIPFWVNHMHLAALAQYSELIERMSVEIGH